MSWFYRLVESLHWALMPMIRSEAPVERHPIPDDPPFDPARPDFPGHAWFEESVNHGWDTDYNFRCLVCHATTVSYLTPPDDYRILLAADAIPEVARCDDTLWFQWVDNFRQRFPNGAGCQQILEWRRERMAELLLEPPGSTDEHDGHW